MNPTSAASAYRESALLSAPPIKLVHMMYEGALRFLEQAEALDPENDGPAFADRLGKADAVVTELRLSLDHAPAPEVSKNLDSLYLFVEDQVRLALLERTTAPIPAAKGVLSTLLEGWKELEVGEARRVDDSEAGRPLES